VTEIGLRRWLPEYLQPQDLILLAAVTLLPWAFGGVEVWAYRMAAFLIALAWALEISDKKILSLLRPIRLGLLLGGLLAGWALFQTVPLPSAVLSAISPRAATLQALVPPAEEGLPSEAFDLHLDRVGPDRVGEPLPAGQPDGWRPISLLPGATRERLAWFLALYGAFALVFVRCREKPRAHFYQRALLWTVAVLACVGLFQAIAGNGNMLWIRTPPRGSRPFGPYVNPVNFVAVLELLLPALLGYAWVHIREGHGAGWKKGKTWLLCTGVLLGLLCVPFAGSKSGALLTGVGMLVTAWVMLRSWRGRGVMLAGLVVCGAIAIPLLTGTRLGERLLEAQQTEWGTGSGRVQGWLAGLDGIGDYFWTGSGFGSFREVIPAYMPPGEYARWYQLHNDPLEAVFEGGLPTALLLIALFLWTLLGVARAMDRSRRHRRPAVFGLGVGVLVLSVHSLWDFNHQIPANALLFVTAVAWLLAYGARNGRS
jgi:hypothetical protein